MHATTKANAKWPKLAGNMDLMFFRLLGWAFLHEEREVQLAAWVLLGCLLLSVAVVFSIWWF
jgi:hypothetical protein